MKIIVEFSIYEQYMLGDHVAQISHISSKNGHVFLSLSFIGLLLVAIIVYTEKYNNEFFRHSFNTFYQIQPKPPNKEKLEISYTI